MMINDVLAAAERLAEAGVQAEVVKLNILTPLDPALVLESVRRTGVLLTAEDCTRSGSVGQRLAAALAQAGLRAKTVLLNCGDKFVHHGDLASLRRELFLDCAGIVERAEEVLDRGE